MTTTTDTTTAPDRWLKLRQNLRREHAVLITELKELRKAYRPDLVPDIRSAKFTLMQALTDRLAYLIAAGDSNILNVVNTDRLKSEIMELRSWMTAPDHPRGVALAQYDWLAQAHAQYGLDGVSWTEVAETLCLCCEEHDERCQESLRTALREVEQVAARYRQPFTPGKPN
jgi:hypothetical protein